MVARERDLNQAEWGVYLMMAIESWEGEECHVRRLTLQRGPELESSEDGVFMWKHLCRGSEAKKDEEVILTGGGDRLL